MRSKISPLTQGSTPIVTKYEADLLCQNITYINTKGRGVRVSHPVLRLSSEMSEPSPEPSQCEMPHCDIYMTSVGHVRYSLYYTLLHPLEGSITLFYHPRPLPPPLVSNIGGRYQRREGDTSNRRAIPPVQHSENNIKMR